MSDLIYKVLNIECAYENTEKMYRNSFRGRGRGRGFRRSTPYGQRNVSETDNTIPRPTPEANLTGSDTKERAIAKANDDARLARDWKTYFEKYFEKERYSIPRPSNSHLVPEAEIVNKVIDGIILEAKEKCKNAMHEHLLAYIEKAEERVKNPPDSAEQQMMVNVAKILQSQQEASLKVMIEAMARTVKETLQQQNQN